MINNFIDTDDVSLEAFYRNIVETSEFEPLAHERVRINKLKNEVHFSHHDLVITLKSSRSEWDLARCVMVIGSGRLGHTNWIKQELKKRVEILVIETDASTGVPDVVHRESH